MVRRSRSIAIVLSLSIAVPLGAAQRGAPPLGIDGRGQSRPSSQPLSPSVIGSWLMARDGDGAERFEVLVLWRGTPGWFMRPTGRGSSMAGEEVRSPLMDLSIWRGGMHLSAIFDPTTRIVKIRGQDVRLGDGNVVLVDQVNDPAGPRVLETVTAPLRGPSSPLRAALIGTPKLLDYLRCLAQVPEPQNSIPMSFVCSDAIAQRLVTGERTVTPVPAGVMQSATGTLVPRPGSGPAQSSTNAALSPVVEGGWFTTVQPSGGALLDLLVLWRGTPGWHLGSTGGGGGRSTGGASGGLQRMSIARSGMPVLTAVLDRLSKSCEIQGKQVPLGDHNVVLVYVADSDAGVKIEKTLRVDPTLPSSREIEAAIRRSPEIIEFLRCDAKLPDPRYQRTIDAMCARYSGG